MLQNAMKFDTHKGATPWNNASLIETTIENFWYFLKWVKQLKVKSYTKKKTSRFL